MKFSTQITPFHGPSKSKLLALPNAVALLGCWDIPKFGIYVSPHAVSSFGGLSLAKKTPDTINPIG